MAVAVFNLGVFLARYPEFTNFNTARPGALLSMFSEAGLYLTNSATGCSPVPDIGQRSVLLNMVTAHIAYIGGALQADGQARPVGRISDASEGSVSASFADVAATPGTGAWYAQSQYGAAFWQATANLRGFNYRPRPTNLNGLTANPLLAQGIWRG